MDALLPGEPIREIARDIYLDKMNDIKWVVETYQWNIQPSYITIYYDNKSDLAFDDGVVAESIGEALRNHDVLCVLLESPTCSKQVE